MGHPPCHHCIATVYDRHFEYPGRRGSFVGFTGQLLSSAPFCGHPLSSKDAEGQGLRPLDRRINEALSLNTAHPETTFKCPVLCLILHSFLEARQAEQRLPRQLKPKVRELLSREPSNISLAGFGFSFRMCSAGPAPDLHPKTPQKLFTYLWPERDLLYTSAPKY